MDRREHCDRWPGRLDSLSRDQSKEVPKDGFLETAVVDGWLVLKGFIHHEEVQFHKTVDEPQSFSASFSDVRRLCASPSMMIIDGPRAAY